MTLRAQHSNALGTIVDGRVRDLQEHRDLGFPVFARAVGTTAPQELLRISEVDVPVQLQSGEQEVTVCPGDYLIGDLDGVVCLPKGLAERAVGLMGSQVRADELIKRDLKEGRPFAESCREHRAKVVKVEDL